MPTTDAARVAVVNRSLLKLGEPASYAINQTSDLDTIVGQVWPAVEARAVATYDWTHFRATVAPVAVPGATGNGWAYAFTLPAARVGEPIAILDRIVGGESYLRDFMIETGKLYTMISAVWVRYRVASAPVNWDAGFTEAYAMALAGELAIPLLADERMAADFRLLAWGRPEENYSGGLFGKLIGLNKAAQPQGRGFMVTDPLTAARWS